MAYFAMYDGERTPVTEIPKGVDAFCPECGEVMRVWNPSTYARHLKHSKNIGGSGGGGGSGCSGGEGEDHERWKVFAYDALLDAFEPDTDPDAFDDETKAALLKEKGVDAPVSDKENRIGDVVMTFAEPDRQLGDGLIVEVQDQNKSKDLFLTTQDYIDQGFSVVWLYEEDFSDTAEKCLLDEVDFRHRAREAALEYAWPDVVAQRDQWEWTYPTDEIKNVREHTTSDSTTVPATIVRDWVLPTAAEYWGDAPWPARFPDADTTPEERHLLPYTLPTPKAEVPATFTREWVYPAEQKYWEETNWSERFEYPDVLPEERYRLQCATGHGTTLQVPATVPKHWVRPTTAEYWDERPWGERFDNADTYPIDSTPTETEAAYPAAWDYSANLKHLSVKNAPRNCGDCGERATVYVHGYGFRCGDCWDAPKELADAPSDRTGIDPRATTPTLD